MGHGYEDHHHGLYACVAMNHLSVHFAGVCAAYY